MDSDARVPRKDDAADTEIKVEDRRRFRIDGAAPPAAEPQDAAEPAPAPAAATDPGPRIELPGGGVLERDAGVEPELPLGFADLVQPFLLMALAGLGVIPHPETNAPQLDLRGAKAAIELLDLLQRKTEGQRTAEETQLLERVLFELKMQFVALRERQPRG